LRTNAIAVESAILHWVVVHGHLSYSNLSYQVV
jgi:hypothetical protein